MKQEIDQLLKQHQLSLTASRKKILEIFLAMPGALSHADIEKKAGEKFDRVTVYRTLQVFLEKGIIHSIPTAENTIHYALCKDNCYEGHHHDNHVHFICGNCGQTTCLEHVQVPEVKLPKGFSPKQVEMIISGTCNTCRVN